jgi:hypothetical protein
MLASQPSRCLRLSQLIISKPVPFHCRLHTGVLCVCHATPRPRVAHSRRTPVVRVTSRGAYH